MGGLLPLSGAQAETSAAQDWIEEASERSGSWRDHGELAFPSGRLFVGDPTWGGDYHLRTAAPAPDGSVNVRSFGDGQDGMNYAIWLEAAGTRPAARGETLAFGVDAAVLSLGDFKTGEAFVDLGEALIEAGQGDSFDWILPHIQASPNFAKWLPIPPDDAPMFLATTNNDGGYAAVWLYDEANVLSGILIDLRGRKSDLKFLDALLPGTQ